MAKKTKVIDKLTKKTNGAPVMLHTSHDDDMVELPRSVLNKLLKKAISAEVNDHECSCGDSCGGNCKCKAQKEEIKPIANPIVEYSIGSVEGTVLFDRSVMSTGYSRRPCIDCNVIADDETGGLFVEVPDDKGVCWHATLDRPCIVGSKERPYGIFIPKNCAAEGLEGIGESLIDMSRHALPEIAIPFMEKSDLGLESGIDENYYYEF